MGLFASRTLCFLFCLILFPSFSLYIIFIQFILLAKSYGAFLASTTLIRKIPRLLGPGLNKAGKFPTAMGAGEDVADKVEGAKASVKFQLKGKKNMCMGVAVGNIKMKKDDLVTNINLAINFLVSLLPKHWQQIKRLYLKSTQGSSHRIYGF